jgi:putative addiction module component (TIGR02574 family)
MKRRKAAGSKRTRAPQQFLHFLPEPQRARLVPIGVRCRIPGIYNGPAPPCTEYLPTRTGGNHLTSRTRILTRRYGDASEQHQSLYAAEKFELLDALWEDVETHAPALSSRQAEELDRRIAAYEKNPPPGRHGSR